MIRMIRGVFSDGPRAMSWSLIVLSAIFSAWSIGAHMMGELLGQAGLLAGVALGPVLAILEARGPGRKSPSRAAAFTVGLIGTLIAHTFFAWSTAQHEVKITVDQHRAANALMEQAETQADTVALNARLNSLSEELTIERGKLAEREALRAELAALPTGEWNRRVGEIQAVIGTTPDSIKYSATVDAMAAYVTAQQVIVDGLRDRRDSVDRQIEESRDAVTTGQVAQTKIAASEVMSNDMLASLVGLTRPLALQPSDPTELSELDIERAGVGMFAIIALLFVVLSVANVAAGVERHDHEPDVRESQTTMRPRSPPRLEHDPAYAGDGGGRMPARHRAACAARRDLEGELQRLAGAVAEKEAEDDALAEEALAQQDLRRQIADLRGRLGEDSVEYPRAVEVLPSAHAPPPAGHAAPGPITSETSHTVHTTVTGAGGDVEQTRRELTDLTRRLTLLRNAEAEAAEARARALSPGYQATPDELQRISDQIARLASDRRLLEDAINALRARVEGSTTVNVHVYPADAEPDGVDEHGIRIDWGVMRARARLMTAPLRVGVWLVAPDGRLLDTRQPGAQHTQIYRDWANAQRDAGLVAGA